MLTNLHATAAEHTDCNMPAAAAAVGVVEVGMVPAGHNWAVSMHHTVLAAAVAGPAACKSWKGVARIAAGLGAAGGSTGASEVDNDGDCGLGGCNLPAPESLVHRPVQPVSR